LGVDVANVLMNFRLWYAPTITTNGTSQTPRNQYIGGGVGSTVVTTFSLPTVSSSGTLIRNYEVGQNNNSYNAVEDFSIILAANQNLLLTADPGSNNRLAQITAMWCEI
jgi:hypothetical protein